MTQATSPQSHPQSLPAAELQRYLDIATEAALNAGSYLKQYWGNLQDIQEKRPGDLVTEADRAAEAAVLATLQLHVPDHAILDCKETGKMNFSGRSIHWMARQTMPISIPVWRFRSDCFITASPWSAWFITRFMMSSTAQPRAWEPVAIAVRSKFLKPMT
jgi:3'-phosphoadenosine 5'-phosphosulfate (PAPS) 3'-phosphatase